MSLRLPIAVGLILLQQDDVVLFVVPTATKLVRKLTLTEDESGGGVARALLF